jgi:peptide/nickel transport system substrate-binding protein
VNLPAQAPRRRLRAVLAIPLIALVVAAGCSSGGGNSSGSNGGPASPGAGEADPSGVLRVGYDLRPQSGGGWYFDPTEAVTTVHEGWMYMLYGRLLRPTQEGELVPDQAESTLVVDPNTIDITLRAGQTFSDGTPFDAEAVKAGLERNLALGDRAVFTEPFYDLTAVAVTGPSTVRLTIADGKAASWHDTFLPGFQTTITKPGQTDFADPIGAGPFTVTSFRSEQAVTYTKSPTYWDAASIQLGGIEIVQVGIDQSASGSAALQSGQVDLTATDASQLPVLVGDLDLYSQTDPNQTVSLQICKREGPLADARVRQAINKAIQREDLSAAIYADTATPATGPWPDDHRFSNPAIAGELAHDVDGAKALLAEAGYGDGLDVDLYVVAGLGLPEAAEVLEQQLAEIGVRLNIIIPPNYVADFLNAQRPGMGLYPGGAENREKLNQWSGDATSNTCKYQNEELNVLIGQLATVSDSSQEAVDLWHQIDEVAIGEALSGFVLFRSRLAGYNTSTVGAVDLWPQGSVVIPDPRGSWIKA